MSEEEIEEIYEIEALVKLEIPKNVLPMAAVEGTAGRDEAIEGKVVQLHVPEQIKKDLEGEFVKVKSGVYENMAMGWITKIKRISLGLRKWGVEE